MSTKTISVDLHPVNLGWLEAQTGASGNHSLSETLNRVLDQARTLTGTNKVRSVRGTIRLPADGELEQADDAVREMFRSSMERTARQLAEANGKDS